MSDILHDLSSNVIVIRCFEGALPAFKEQDSNYKMAHEFPPIDMFMDAGVFHLYADLPGVSADDVSIYLFENFLVIEGAKRRRAKGSGYKFIRLERHFKSFKRVFQLPFNTEHYEARLDDGVLHIALAR